MNLKNLVKSPYNLFVFTAIVIAVTSFFFKNDKIDFHLHDTYFIIADIYILWAVAFLLICIWGVYRLTDSILLSNWLIWLHTAATIFVLLAIFTSDLWFKQKTLPSRRYYTDDSFQSLINEYGATFFIFLAIVVMFLVGQLAFLVNVVGGLVKYLSFKYLVRKKQENR